MSSDVGTKKTLSETLEERSGSLHKIMSECVRFRDFLHDEARQELESFCRRHKGKRDSEWTLEDIEKAKKLITFWTTEISRLQEATKVFTDVRRRYEETMKI